jgi:hypothetical protein
MKKTIHKNYSLLILVLLILYMTFINLPDDQNYNMKGGKVIDPNNPYLGMDDDKLVEKLGKYSTIFNILNKYFYVYCGLIVILLGLAGYFAYTQYQIQGVPMLGQEGAITWDSSGQQFLNYYYSMSKERYGLFSSSNNANPNLMKNFESDFDKMVLTKDSNGNIARDSIDTFCNVVSPCNICSCSGPDPNYAGKPENTPIIPFKGKCPNFGECQPTNDSGKPSPKDAAKNVVKMQNKRGVQDLFFSRIPNCCCQVWKSQLGDAANFTKEKLSDFANNLPAELGLSPTTGCEPSKASITNAPSLTGEINGKPSTVRPFTTPSGSNTYIYDMVVSCAKKHNLKDLDPEKYKKDTKNVVVNSVSPEFMSCKDYDLDLDEGVSAAHVAKNSRKYLTPSIGNTPVPADPGDVSKNWTSGIWNETTGQAPKISVTKPTNWPSVDPFSRTKRGVINNFWYKSSSNILYQLNINNRLFEIGAYPVKTIDREIYTDELTDVSAKAYLDSFLSADALARNKDIFIYGGSYYIP